MKIDQLERKIDQLAEQNAILMQRLDELDRIKKNNWLFNFELLMNEIEERPALEIDKSDED